MPSDSILSAVEMREMVDRRQGGQFQSSAMQSFK